MNDDFTFDGFEPANTTPVPDVLFDVLLSKLSGAEIKVMLYIIRRTLGFKKSTDAISLTQFEKGITTQDGKVLDEGCGLNRETICKALKTLEEKGCIKATKRNAKKRDKDTTLYSIRFKGEAISLVGKSDHVPSRKSEPPTLVGKSAYGSRKNSIMVVGKSDLQETVIQVTDKQETEESTDASAIAPAARTPSQQAQEMEEIRSATTEQGDTDDNHNQPSERTAGFSSRDTFRHSPSTSGDTYGITPAQREEVAYENENHSHKSGSVTQAKPGREKSTRTAKAKVVELVPTAEEQVILDMWQSIFKRRIPINEALIKAAGRLVPCEPTLQDLKDCRGFCYTSNGEWYKKKGVQLSDIVGNWAKWQTTLELPPAEEAPLPQSRYPSGKPVSNDDTEYIRTTYTPGGSFKDEFYPSEAEKRAAYAEAN